jgi:hypothetical protein
MITRVGRITGEWGTGKDFKRAVWSLRYYIGMFLQTEKSRNLSHNRRWPCKESKPVPPERALQFQGVIPTQSYPMLQCHNLNWQDVPYNSRASPLHQASRRRSVITTTACFIFPSLLQDVKVVCYVHTFYTSNTNFNIILAPEQTFAEASKYQNNSFLVKLR